MVQRSKQTMRWASRLMEDGQREIRQRDPHNGGEWPHGGERANKRNDHRAGGNRAGEPAMTTSSGQEAGEAPVASRR